MVLDRTIESQKKEILDLDNIIYKKKQEAQGKVEGVIKAVDDTEKALVEADKELKIVKDLDEYYNREDGTVAKITKKCIDTMNYYYFGSKELIENAIMYTCLALAENPKDCNIIINTTYAKMKAFENETNVEQLQKDAIDRVLAKVSIKLVSKSEKIIKELISSAPSNT